MSKKDQIIKIRVTEEERKTLEDDAGDAGISEVIRSRLFSDTRVYLYRYFNVSEELLYVGVTINLRTRSLDHKHKSIWFPEVASTKVKTYFSRMLAEEAEKKAIQEENPKYNIRDLLQPDEEYRINKNLINGMRNIVISITNPQYDFFKKKSEETKISMKKIIGKIIEDWKDEE